MPPSPDKDLLRDDHAFQGDEVLMLQAREEEELAEKREGGAIEGSAVLCGEPDAVYLCMVKREREIEK
jgi:hypothetical protein